MKKRILSTAILSIVLILAMFSRTLSVEAFDTDIHEKKTNIAFDNLAREGINFSPAARDKVNKANKGQDSVLSGTWDPKFHGDRLPGETHAQAFDRLRKYIKEEQDKAIALINQCKTLDGLDALGRVLHAVQDFYAHSNYVELSAAGQAAARAALDDPTQPIPADIQMCGWWGWPYTVADHDIKDVFGIKVVTPADPLRYSHTDHNKDRPDRPGYAAANAAAVSHTTDILREKWKKLTPAKQAEIAALLDIPFGTTQRMCSASYVIPHNYYNISLLYTGSLAVDLTIEEGLPYGISFQSSDPLPTYVNTTFNATIVGWKFHDAMPIPHKEIKYQIYVGDEATTLPTVVSHCEVPIPGYVNFRGSVMEVDTNGTTYETSIGGDQLVRISGPVFGTSHLSVTPPEVDIGEEITISLLVANTGDLAGSYEVALKIDDVVLATKAVTLDAGASEKVTFTTSKDVAGTYNVSVDGLSGTFVVKEVAPPPTPPAPPLPAPTPTPTPTPTPMPTPTAPEVKPPINWPLVGGIIGGVVLIGLGVFFWMRRRAA